MHAPNDNTAPKGLRGWWLSPPRPGMHRLINPWEYAADLGGLEVGLPTIWVNTNASRRSGSSGPTDEVVDRVLVARVGDDRRRGGALGPQPEPALADAAALASAAARRRSRGARCARWSRPGKRAARLTRGRGVLGDVLELGRVDQHAEEAPDLGLTGADRRRQRHVVPVARRQEVSGQAIHGGRP